MTTKRFDAGRWLRDHWLELLLLGVLLVAVVWLATVGREIWQIVQPEPPPPPPVTAPASAQDIDGPRTAGIASFLAALGPRTAGSAALAVAAERIEQELRESGWQVEVRPFDLNGVTRRNIVATAGAGPAVLLATHYDSSPLADRDPDPANHNMPAPGANDGGSGAAVLLELARALNRERLAGQVWLVLLDGQYGADSTPIAAGMQALLDAPPWAQPPEAALLVYLLGADGQQFAIDPASDALLTQQIWQIAAQQGYGAWFTTETRAAVELGQSLLTGLNVPVAVIAGSDYPYWRTSLDTVEQINADSLARAGRVLQSFLEQWPLSP
jgi:glutaminyl-peptide cyclotransferase